MKKTKTMTLSAILIALGIIIPMFMPKIPIPPASFTLASHVPVFIAMFISPTVAVSVALGTALGFYITATPIIAIRALSHVVFAILGSLYLKKHQLTKAKDLIVFNTIIALIHASCEVLVVLPFLGTPTTEYWISMVLLIGIGGFVHSLVDFTISYTIVKRLPQSMVK